MIGAIVCVLMIAVRLFFLIFPEMEIYFEKTKLLDSIFIMEVSEPRGKQNSV